MADENNITTLAKRLRPFIKMAAQEMVPVTPYDHGDLTGLASDDHTQYVHNTTARTITAVHTFDPTTATAPFILSADAQGQTVTGLKADQLNKSVTAGAGLTGGGALTADISLAVGAGNGITVNADDVALTTPGTLNYTTSNNAAGSHTHAITNSDSPTIQEILSCSSSLALTLSRINIDVLADKSGGDLTIAPTGNIILHPVQAGSTGSVLPTTTYDTNLGAINKKYLTLHAAELWVETLVAQQTIATIGGRILVGPTTTLTRPLDNNPATTVMYVKHNEMATHDYVYMEVAGKVEWFHIDSSGTLQAEGDYQYSMTRNLDGSGCNSWDTGDAVFNTGAQYEGYIDIYSRGSPIRAPGSMIGPTITGTYRWGDSYSSVGETWAIGNLNGLYGYSTNKYGVAIGFYGWGWPYITLDTDNGIRFNYLDVSGVNHIKAQWDKSGEIIVGDRPGGLPHVHVTSTGVFINKSDTTNIITLSSDGGITIKDYLGTNTVIRLDTSGDAIFGRSDGSYANMFWDTSAGTLNFRSGTGTAQITINTSGQLTAGAGAVILDANGISIAAGNYEVNGVYWKDGSTNVGWVRCDPDVGMFIHQSGHYGQMSITCIDPTTTYEGFLYLQPDRNPAYVRLGIEDNELNMFTGRTTLTNYFNISGSGGNCGLVVGHSSYTPPSNSIVFIGDLISYKGAEYKGYIFVPITTALINNTYWEGQTHSTVGTSTEIDLHSATTGFSLPADVKAIYAQVVVKDSGSISSSLVLSFGPTSSNYYTLQVRPQVTNILNDNNGIIPCDSNGHIWWRCTASGTDTLYAYLRIWGYWI